MSPLNKIEPLDAQDESIPKTEIAVLLQQEMQEHGLRIEQVREITESTYETARRFVRGMTVPSDAVLKLLAVHFGWNMEEAKVMAIRDRERMRNGDLFDIAHGQDPAVQKIVRAWPLLNKFQKKLILEQVNTYVASNQSNVVA